MEAEAREAAREYHRTLRRQKKGHWEEFLAEESNIWSAARFLQAGKQGAFAKIPPLKRANGSVTEGKEEQANELLQTFFPPLPQHIEEEGQRQGVNNGDIIDLQEEEIERKIREASPWKAPGSDSLPAMVWRKLWPTVKDEVTSLFRSSLWEGYLPHQWRHAKIIPLKNPGKPDYAVAKAWRPISLLSTLGKAIEAVIAERLLYIAEAAGSYLRTTLEQGGGGRQNRRYWCSRRGSTRPGGTRRC